MPSSRNGIHTTGRQPHDVAAAPSAVVCDEEGGKQAVPERNTAALQEKDRNSGGTDDSNIQDPDSIIKSQVQSLATPNPKGKVAKRWSDEDEDEKDQIGLHFSLQMGWEPESGTTPDSPPIDRICVSLPSARIEVPMDASKVTSKNKSSLSAGRSTEDVQVPTSGSDADLSAANASRQREDGTLQDRFGNDVVEEEWPIRPKREETKIKKGSEQSSALSDKQQEVGWGALHEVEDSDDKEYNYLEVEEVKVPLTGLKVATEPAKTLRLLQLRHLELRQLDWDDVTDDDLEWLSESSFPTNDGSDPNEQPGVLGFALDVGNEEHRGRPPAMCLSTCERALLIRFPERPLGPKDAKMLATVLHSQDFLTASFGMYESVQVLHYHYRLHFARAFDLIEAYSRANIDQILDDDFGIVIERDEFNEEGHPLAINAWAACLVTHAAALRQAFTSDKPHINTFELDAGHFKTVATGSAVAATLTSMEQREHKCYIEKAEVIKGLYVLTQGRYSTRARREDKVTLMMEDSVEWSGQVQDSHGREIVVRPLKTNRVALDVESVRDTPCLVMVAPHLPPQETARRGFARSFFLGGVDLDECRVIRNLFLGAVEAENERPMPLSHSPKIEPVLNDAQAEGIRRIFDNSAAVLIHGPPGSGKTTVIAHTAKAFLLSDPSPDSTMMIVANSNAAIKQCAEALLKHRVAGFRLVTSTEYYVGWHSHHYSTMLQRKMIQSDELKPNMQLGEMRALFRGVRIILCTLATLATRKLDSVLFERHVPLLVADEASQIVWSTFLPAIWKIRKGLRKAVFVGDELQLPPFGATQNAELIRSVFEIEPRPQALAEVLLDTCYRIPVPLGDFVSDLVYKGALVSKHDLLTWSCTRFIDVPEGRETRVGVSWDNPKEADACAALIQRYYSGSNFCIITPYDAQRDLIERTLKIAGLPHQGRVQSIDAAQGSEYDFVILSLVRTSRTMGFLSDMRRMNVMLTRQRRGLCIVCHPRFLENAAAASLVGQLEHYASQRVAWSEKLHISIRDVFANIASPPMG